MQKPADNKNPRIGIRYTDEEFTRLKKSFARSACHTIAGYVRKISLGEPVEIISRNASFDAFTEEIIQLRKEMSALRQNTQLPPDYHQLLTRLHEQIQTTIDKIATLCTPQ